MAKQKIMARPMTLAKPRIDYRLDAKTAKSFWQLKPKNMTQKEFVNIIIRKFKGHYTKHAETYQNYRNVFTFEYEYDLLDRQYAVLLEPDNHREINQISDQLRNSTSPFYYSHYIREAIIYYLITLGLLKYKDDYLAKCLNLNAPRVNKILESIETELKLIPYGPCQI